MRWSFVPPLLLSMGLLACASSSEPPPSAPSPLLGNVLPDFDAETLNGTPISTASMTDRALVVSFFSGDCDACKPTLSSLQDLSSSYSEVTFIGVSQDAEASDARHVASEQSLTFPIVHDAGRRLAKSFRVKEPPRTFVVGADGRVRWVGAAHGKDDLERAIAAIAP